MTWCAAIVVWLFASSGFWVSTSAAEENSVQAANTGTNSFGPEHLGITTTPAPDSAVTASNSASTDAAEAAAAQLLLPDTGEIYDLILNVRRKRDILSPGLLGLQKGFTNYVPLVELARILKFPTDVNLAAGRASGTFMNPENSYSIDANAHTITVAGETTEIPADSVIVRDLGSGLGDIYVTPEVLNQLWNLNMILDFSDLTLNIKTRQLLPYEKEELRKDKQERLEDEKDEPVIPLNYDYVPNDYKMYGLQAFTLTDQLLWDGTESALSNTLIVSGQGDLLGTTADYTANIVSNRNDGIVDLTQARLRFTRQDFGTGTLPLGLKIAQAGDVYTRPSPLIDETLQGRGIYISSRNRANRSVSFDKITVEGTGQPGWEVELYRGRELLDFGFINERGEYRFENVPLNYGDNDIRVVLYGPQGQIEERLEDYSIGSTMLKPGETTIDGGMVDYRKDLIPVDDEPDRKDDGLATTMRVDRGINHWLTGFATFTDMPTVEDQQKYFSVGGIFKGFGGSGQLEAYKQLQGGTAFDARFASRFAGIRYNARTSFFRDFESRETGFGNNAKTFEGEFRANKSFNLGTSQLGLTFDTLETHRKDGDRTTRIRTQESLGFNNFTFNNQIITTLQNGAHSTSDGTVSLNTVFDKNWSLRNYLDYDLYPERDLDRTRLELRYADGRDFSGGLSIDQGIRDPDRTTVGLNASYDFGTFLGGAQLDWERGDGVSLLLSATTTFGPDGPANEEGTADYIFTSEYKGYSTALRARMFMDNDMDGLFGAGDEPVEKARIRINGRRSDPSDIDGYIDVLGAGPPGLAEVTLDRETLPDQFLDGLRDGYKTVLRPRTKPFVDFALILTGVIDGTVRFPDGTPVPGLIVQLVNDKNEVVKEIPTLFDGFYNFEFVRPGTYTVRVHPSHQVFVPPTTVTVTSTELVAFGVDLQLQNSEQAAEVPVVDKTEGASGRIAQVYHAPTTGGTEQPAPFSSDDGFQTIVRAVRIGEHPYKVRLVLDLSGPAEYRITSENDGQIINIDLPSTAWDAQRNYELSTHPVFSNFEVIALPGGKGTRLRLTARSKTEVFYNTLLEPSGDKPDRLDVDFMRIP
jgi:hypothetical protein